MRNQSNSPPLRVLVVEDDLDVRSNLQDILELDGHRVAIATSVREAAADEDLSDYAVILLDRRLPDGNGDDLLPFIREAAPETAVILITGHANLDVAITALRHGAVDFLLKPIEPEMLRSRLKCIAEQLRMRDELAAAQRKLVQSERLAAIGQTLAVLSHEARNELNGLRMGLTLLPEILEDREQALEIIGHLTKNEDRLHRLFEDVRGFAAPVQLDRTDCDVREVWRKAWSSLEPAWKNRDVSFEEENGDTSNALSGDAFRLEQVFRNLFENSLAACADPVVIGISCAQAGGQSGVVSLAVRDNGSGLTEEQEEKVFDAFFTTKSSGTGLGMAIVKRIIEAHGGTICVGDSQLRGAEFIIALPLASGWSSGHAHRPEALSIRQFAVPSPSFKNQSRCFQP
jgi:signal transduction histidine kinase